MQSRTASAVAAAVTIATALALTARAHEGHGKSAGSTFDPNAPKRVSAATASAIGLQTAEVDFGHVERVLRLSGMVRPLPDRVQAVAPRIAGIVRTIRVRVGDAVRVGDIIAEIDSPESLRLTSELVIARSRAEQAGSLLETARERETLARSERERVEANAEAVAQNTLSEKRTKSVEARGEVRRLEADFTQATREAEALKRLIDALGATESGVLVLASSIDGVVVMQSAIIGQGVDRGQSIAQIVDLTRVQIEGEVPESLLSHLAAARDAVVRVRSGTDGSAFGEGKVRFVSPVVDASKRTGHIFIDAENPSGALRQGQFVDLAVVLGANGSAVVVPPSAVVKEGPLQYVFVKEGDTFRKRDVAVGQSDGRAAEITQGLVPGDVVAISGAFSLSQLKGEVPLAPGAAAEPASDGHGHSHD